jgi:hypothetical protein
MKAESIAALNLNNFIVTERKICESAFPGIEWDSNSWPILKIDPSYRAKPFDLVFNVNSQPIVGRDVDQPQRKSLLPSLYREFCKALVMYLKRTLGVKARALYAYLNEAKRLYNVMYFRGKASPIHLSNYHFQYLHAYLVEIGYVQLYDATTNLSKISSIVDSSGISITASAYKTSERPTRQHLKVKFESEEPNGKEFSREAVEAFAVATNNPVNEGEEILLRTLDLLFAMGQRANEVTHIPLDCWVERVEKDSQGRDIKMPKTGEPIKTYGIRYYAEKMAKDRVHWLADQDVQFARRAVQRLTKLTENSRAVARFQRENPGRIWDIAPERALSYPEISEYLSFASHDGLQKFLHRIGVSRLHGPQPFYKAGEIERAIITDSRLGEHVRNTVALADETGKPVLYKEELLSLVFDGSFRMKRIENLIRVAVVKVSVVDLNIALGADPTRESVFDRRKLTEADGSPIVLTTHMPRHWRNTLYEIAGMSEAQQALALGRADISQNPHYQHATIEEKNSSLHELINTRNPQRRLELFKQGIRGGVISGSLANTYNLLNNRSPLDAEEFLNIHAMAANVTPYGACANDFSKAPCPKHLQCFDSCSHLHRTDNPNEAMQLDKLIRYQEKNILRMKDCGLGEAGAEVWIAIEDRKLSGMKAAREIKTDGAPVKVFPEGRRVNGKRKRSAFRED